MCTFVCMCVFACVCCLCVCLCVCVCVCVFECMHWVEKVAEKERGQAHQGFLVTVCPCNEKTAPISRLKKNRVAISERKDNQRIALLRSHYDDTVIIALKLVFCYQL